MKREIFKRIRYEIENQTIPKDLSFQRVLVVEKTVVVDEVVYTRIRNMAVSSLSELRMELIGGSYERWKL